MENIVERIKNGKRQVMIFRPYFTRKGKVYYASSYGLKAWSFWVDAE